MKITNITNGEEHITCIEEDCTCDFDHTTEDECSCECLWCTWHCPESGHDYEVDHEPEANGG